MRQGGNRGPSLLWTRYVRSRTWRSSSVFVGGILLIHDWYVLGKIWTRRKRRLWQRSTHCFATSEQLRKDSSSSGDRWSRISSISSAGSCIRGRGLVVGGLVVDGSCPQLQALACGSLLCEVAPGMSILSAVPEKLPTQRHHERAPLFSTGSRPT